MTICAALMQGCEKQAPTAAPAHTSIESPCWIPRVDERAKPKRFRTKTGVESAALMSVVSVQIAEKEMVEHGTDSAPQMGICS
jgi:hypothetical protein